jgi:alpha-L-fucosidase
VSIEPSWLMPVAVDDSPETILSKAARIVPSPRQRAWQERELIAFIHFGINTFTDNEWGTGREDPALFAPTDLNARRWCQVLHEAGFKQIVLTAKHHDGFCLWPSRYTNFSVKRSPWRNGRGDVVREVVDAAREFGLKVGLYLSPADLHEMEAPGGRYGNGSPAVASVIPGSVPGDSRTPARTFTFAVDDYNRYYLNQLYELLTDYGPVHEVWFDGANPKPGVSEVYNYADWFTLVRELAPEAVMAQGPDVRWVGNEEGRARETEWSALPFNGEPETGVRPLDPTAADLGSRARLSEGADYLAWYPAEVDVSIRPGWFYHAREDDQVKSLDRLLDIYYHSVGRNAVLLLNIPPDRRGQFAEIDAKRLHEFGAVIRRTFEHNLAQEASVMTFPGPLDDPASGSAIAVAANPDTCWILPERQTQGELVLVLPQRIVFNCIMLQEDLSVGQRVEAFAVDAWDGERWQPIASGTTIGYKRLLRVDAIETQGVRLRILEARLNPAIKTFGLYRE